MEQLRHAITDEELEKLKRKEMDGVERGDMEIGAEPANNNRHERRRRAAIERLGARLKTLA